MEYNVMWKPLANAGIEHLSLRQSNAGMMVDGLVIGIGYDDMPFRLHYEIRTDETWIVKECHLQLLGDDPRKITLRADSNRHWSDASGVALPELDGCIDMDIKVTPFTNTLPIRRLVFESGQTEVISVAYISVPELTVMSMPQRYTCLAKNADGGLYRYENLVSGYTCELNVDAQGLVVDYPGNWKRVWPNLDGL